MDPAGIYAKTDKGLEEMQVRTYKLPLKSRTLLIMVDGKAPASEIIDKGKAAGNTAAYATLAELEAQGFIALAKPSEAAASPGAAIETLRRFGIDQMLALLGPGADVFTERIEEAQDLRSLLVELEKCRAAISSTTGAQKSVRFWAGVQERLPAEARVPQPVPTRAAPTTPPASKVHPDATRRQTIPSVRRFAIDYLRALPGPHGQAFAERIESSADRNTLVGILERSRNAVQLALGEEAAKEYWEGVQSRMPPG